MIFALGLPVNSLTVITTGSDGGTKIIFSGSMSLGGIGSGGSISLV